MGALTAQAPSCCPENDTGACPGGALPACQDLRAERVPAWLAPRGYLYGTTTLINVNSGLAFTADAEALANLATAPYYRPPSDPYPDFDAAEIGNVASFVRNDKLYRIAMPTGLGAVEAAMVRAWIDNEVVPAAATPSATDWVVTMPPRRFYRSGRASPWFNASDLLGPDPRLTGQYTSRSGVVVPLRWFDCGFPECPGPGPIDIRAQWAATVFGFRASPIQGPSGAASTTNALGSRNGWLVDLAGAPAARGALHLQFYDIPARELAATHHLNPDDAIPTPIIL